MPFVHRTTCTKFSKLGTLRARSRSEGEHDSNDSTKDPSNRSQSLVSRTGGVAIGRIALVRRRCRRVGGLRPVSLGRGATCRLRGLGSRARMSAGTARVLADNLVRHVDILRGADLARVGDGRVLALLIAGVLETAGDPAEKLLVSANAGYVERVAICKFIATYVFTNTGDLYISRLMPRSVHEEVAWGREAAYRTGRHILELGCDDASSESDGDYGGLHSYLSVVV